MSEPQKIAFNVPSVEGRELDHVRAAVESGKTSSGGPYAGRVSELLREETGAAEALLTTSCTGALEMTALLLDLEPGDVVIVPSFTFVSSAMAYVRAGARIAFCDIEPETLGPDPRDVARILEQHGDRVRAIVLVHYAGIAGDIEGLQEVLRDRPDVALIEDNAHGLYGRWRGRPLGSLGRFATLSFHDTKNFSCGEGGALLVNDDADAARSLVIYDKGTDRQAFLRGMVDKYSWRDIGSSFGMADTLAAFLYGQLEQREVIQGKRRRIFETYAAALAPYADRLGIRLPVVPEDRVPAYHLFHVLMPDLETRTRVIDDLRAEGIGTAFHYVPLHNSTAGRRFATGEVECPVTVDISERLLRLPFHNNLTEAECERVVEALIRSLKGGPTREGGV